MRRDPSVALAIPTIALLLTWTGPDAAASRTRPMRAQPAPAVSPAAAETLSLEEAREDLAVVALALREAFAYLRAGDVDVGAALTEARTGLFDGISTTRFGLLLQRLLARFVDGHAQVRGYPWPDEHLPFLVERVGERYVALRPDRDDFVDREHPYLVSLDGRSLDRWRGAAREYVAAGSASYVTWQELRWLRHLQLLRRDLGVEERDTVTVTLAGRDPSETVRRTLSMAGRFPTYGSWPRTDSRTLDGGIGYLRLAEMDAAAATEVRRRLPAFRDTRGLVIDVRGNTGGSRDALRALLPYLMAPGEPPVVVNVARYRTHPHFRRDHLGNRFLYRIDSPRWPPGVRGTLRHFAAGFTPEWTPPDHEFSDWHYMVVAREAADDPFHYDRPVAVLADRKSFSATDVFLGALKGRPSVTLVGEASAGGSGRAQTFRLQHSGLLVRLASMASFRPDGRLYDGRGIAPDVAVEASPGFYVDGGDDPVLEAAREMLRRP